MVGGWGCVGVRGRGNRWRVEWSRARGGRRRMAEGRRGRVGGTRRRLWIPTGRWRERGVERTPTIVLCGVTRGSGGGRREGST